MGDLKECVNLEMLNLSYNELNDLSTLRDAKFPRLQYLNLSFNQIKYLSNFKEIN